MQKSLFLKAFGQFSFDYEGLKQCEPLKKSGLKSILVIETLVSALVSALVSESATGAATGYETGSGFRPPIKKSCHIYIYIYTYDPSKKDFEVRK